MVDQKFKAQSFHGFDESQYQHQQQSQQQQQQQQQQQHQTISQMQQHQQPQYHHMPHQLQQPPSYLTDPASASAAAAAANDAFQRHISLPTYLNAANSQQSYPRLVRASSLSTNGLGGHDPKMEQKFLNVKVTLEFQGDINTMTMNWTPKEIEHSRRLVLITFKQNYTHLTLNFKPIDQSDYIPGTPVISCIYWNQTNKFYVTSVDLITLLEYLVNAKFPVEEKNRIRRNLQSLKPLTVSKSNPKYYQFFQLIMNFQNPKPRHIEKDVKVLSWSSLKDSLQKVLSKYTIDPNVDHNYNGNNTTDNSNSNNHHEVSRMPSSTSGTSQSTIPTNSSTSLTSGSISSINSKTDPSSSSTASMSQFTLPQVQESNSYTTTPNISPYYNQYQYQNLPQPQTIMPPPIPQYQFQPMFPTHHLYPPPPPSSSSGTGTNTATTSGPGNPLSYQDHIVSTPTTGGNSTTVSGFDTSVSQQPQSQSGGVGIAGQSSQQQTSTQLGNGHPISHLQPHQPTHQSNYMYYYQ